MLDVLSSIYETEAYNEALNRAVDNVLRINGVRDFLKSKNLLVTGASGQIGGAVVSLLTRVEESCHGGLRIIAATRNQESFERKLGFLPREIVANAHFDATEVFECDSHIDSVIHCAGYGDPSAFVNDPVGVMMANIVGLNRLLFYLARQSSGRMLFVSSGEVYGQGAIDVMSFEEGYSGSIDTTSFRSCYPMAKRAGEALCSSYLKQYGVDSVIARQCHVFGPGFSSRDSRVTAQFLRAAADLQPIVMKSDGSQVRSYMFELDVASAYIVLLACGQSGEAYNVAPDYITSIRELGESIAACAGTALRIELNSISAESAGVGGITRSVLDNSKLRELGWHASFDLNDGVATCVSALRELRD